MPKFTEREIRMTLVIGVVAFVIGLIMAYTGADCLKRGIGTPEYITSLRNTGWTIVLLSILWTAMAGLKKLIQW